MTRSIPKIYSTRFFQLVTSRQFAEADRILERIKQKMHVSDRNRGYFQALYGMLLTMKNSDRYSFLSTIDFANKKQLKNYRQEFLGHMERRLHDDYDRGYFEAWSDYMKVLQKMEAPTTSNSKNTAKQAEARTGTQGEMANTEEPRRDGKAASEATPDTDVLEKKSARPGQSLLLDYAK